MSEKPVSTHEEFNAGDADVVFQSCDGVQFRLHRKNLEAMTGIFPGPEFETKGEVVALAEPADVLQILFKLMYPRRHSGLENLEFSIVAAVAEAAEKYEVFPVINTCVMFLRCCIQDHPLEVLVHGTKHDYPTLIDEAAPQLLFSPIISIAERLPPAWVLPWLRFTEAKRTRIFGKAMEFVKGKLYHPSECSKASNSKDRYTQGICFGCKWSLVVWVDHLERITTRSALNSALLTLQGSTHSSNCSHCGSRACIYTKDVVDIIKQGMDPIPKLTHFR